jgi:hypothetical protein
LGQERFAIRIAIAGDRADFEIGIFDGDGGDPPLPYGHWDLGESVVEYRLLEDPEKNGPSAGDTPIRVWRSGGGPDNPLPMPDNDWFDSGPIPTAVTARAPSGNFFYALEVELISAVAPRHTLAAFKVRSSGPATVEIFEQPFASLASITSGYTDGKVVYSAFPNLEPTTYDGTNSFFLGAESSLDQLMVFDGDMDHGTANTGGPRDTNDPDTPDDGTAAPFMGLPLLDIAPWALDGPTFYEGIACSDFDTPGPIPPCEGGSGEPQEDSPNPVFRRSPPVEYELFAPDGRRWRNDNPSGNREWEQFLVGTGVGCEAGVNADYCESELLPAGVYEVRVSGLDLQNLNLFFFTESLRCVDPDGSPCGELRPFLIGDTVWEDRNGDGFQQGDEPGIPAVVVDQVDHNDWAVDRAVTDGGGEYLFGVEAGEWTVRVRPENFDAFALLGSLGDRVWLDVDGDGLQGAGEPGIPSVRVVLLHAGADGAVGGGDDMLLRDALTDADGNYLFTGLPAGSYYTRVVTDTLPTGLAQSGDPDEAGSCANCDDRSKAVALAADDQYLAHDFGYTSGSAMVGDLVWLDADHDGVLDLGEPGIGGVTMSLIDTGGDGVLGGGDDSVVATTTTSGGYFLFSDVAPGVYAVDVSDTAGKLSGYVLTSGPDSNPDPTAAFTVSADQTFLSKDFGYFTANQFTVSDVVWFDADRDGVVDGGEPPIAGVTAVLTDSRADAIASAVSAADGGFSFTGLPPGSYTIRITDLDAVLNGLLATTAPAGAAILVAEIVDTDVAGSSFGYVAGGNLQGAVATTESPTQTNVVVDDNVLTYDFGYWFPAGGTGTPGYWKNHPEAWPVAEISIGGVLYTQAQALSILQQGKRAGKKGGDKTYTLAASLISAKLNILAGSDDVCISHIVYLADLWLAVNPLGSNVRASSEAWKVGEPLHEQLDDYNNGRLCAPARG